MVLCGDEVDEVRLVYGGSSLLIPHFLDTDSFFFPLKNFLGQINNAQLKVLKDQYCVSFGLMLKNVSSMFMVGSPFI